MKTIEKLKKEQINYNKVVNIAEDGEITVLDYVFDHKDGFKGATGSRFYPVSKEEYEEKTSEDSIIEYLIDSGMELPEQYKRGGFEQLADAIITNGEEAETMFDTSYSELWDYLREECELSKDEAFIFTCSGSGRCFDKDFKGNVNPQLSKIIRQYESK